MVFVHCGVNKTVWRQLIHRDLDKTVAALKLTTPSTILRTRIPTLPPLTKKKDSPIFFPYEVALISRSILVDFRRSRRFNVNFLSTIVQRHDSSRQRFSRTCDHAHSHIQPTSVHEEVNCISWRLCLILCYLLVGLVNLPACRNIIDSPWA